MRSYAPLLRFACISYFFKLPLALQLSSKHQLANGTFTTQSKIDHTFRPSLVTQTPTALSNVSSSEVEVPGLASEFCAYGWVPPCEAYCWQTDTACNRVASSISKTCYPPWESYYNVQLSSSDHPPAGWSVVETTNGHPGELSTSLHTVYTSFSTVRQSVIGYAPMTSTDISGSIHPYILPTTMNPVYALGSPLVTKYVMTREGRASTWLTAPTPECRYTAVYSAGSLGGTPQTTGCGQCTIHGGEVQLYWWPEDELVSNRTSAAPTKPPRTTMLGNSTLVSPSVYASLHKMYASNSCSYVGGRIRATLLAMDPGELSTQVHFGGKVAQSGANYYSRLNYHDLTALPSVSDYQNQPSCIFMGCPTMYPTPTSPTLVVPSRVRTLDPAWADCDAALEGL